ncbi:hypothetical protein LX64_03120 [Chitinophaga skermanii]|uniref:Uncharacterized protein n=1 Tax=Chitinophaga skermanii TaxID=331697 RepID=A0A327QIQ7_9BACT|nr:tetratricopeptide repeat protein [Chitinophaga skermanii]RAJ04240.1 hypothetical protein LX64_03120 [Chitinophaga skermanii]
MRKLCVQVLGWMLLSLTAFSQTQNNVQLQKMADDDQDARKVSNINWMVLNREDSIRRVEVFKLIAEGKVRTAKDHFNAGIVFQHGRDTVDSYMAVKSFESALQLDTTLNRWWYAAAVDRHLMRKGEPQIYGTQYTMNQSSGGKWVRYKIDTTKVSDAQRRYYRVETLAEQQEKERAMNLQSIQQYYSLSGSIDQTIQLIKSEFKKGQQSNYAISEEKINEFGYALLKQDKKQDALKVMQLNTELYPAGFNTFDSYGEVLLLVDQKKAAIKAYKKSLALNPGNENAKEVLKKLQ